MARKSTTRARRRQTRFQFRTWGGKRKNAGRKPLRPGTAKHVMRPALASCFPVHVTMKLDANLPSLREGPLCPAIEACLPRARQRQRFRLVHYSIQDHHLHLIVEAADAVALSRGIQGLAVRLARAVNRALGRRGRVFCDRYFSRILKTPREVRNGLCYVLNNTRRHAAQRRERLAWNWIDDRSSGRYFDGWREAHPLPADGAPVVAPRTWLLITGWRRHGLLRVNEIPGPEP
jgi:putative transposase